MTFSCTTILTALVLRGNLVQTEQLSADLLLVGVAIGMLGLPLVLYLKSRRHRWLAVLAINASYLFAYLVGGWPATAAAVFSSVLAILLSAVLLRQVFDESTWQAFRFQVLSAFGRGNDIQIIEGGKTVVPKDAGKLFGPRTIIIKPNNAVILERGNRQSRISGPAVLQSERFEYVERIFDLKPQHERFSLTQIPTRNMLAVNAVISLTYCLDVPEPQRLGIEAFTAGTIGALQVVDLRIPDWRQATRSVVQSCSRRLISDHELADLFKPSVSERLERQILEAANERCGNWHIRLISLVLEEIQPIADTKEGINERSRAAAQRDALNLLADGYRQARERGMTNEEIQDAVLRRTLEQIAKDSETELFLTPELQDLVTVLRQGRNHKP